MKITYIPRTRDLHKRKVAAYCRVSTLLEEQEDSFEFQQAYYRAFILAHEDWEFVGIYSDEKSGTKTKNRPGFNQLIEDALSGNIDYILCKSVSRFSRNQVDCKKYVQLLTGNGVHIQFEKENIDTGNPASGMMFSFLSTISQDESRSISENVKWAYREKFKQGKYNLGNNRVLGYDAVDGKLVPNKDAEIVRLIFQRCLDGNRTLREITENLAGLGIVGRNGKALTRSGVKYILTNETYVGDKLLQKRAPKNFLTKQPERGVFFESRYIKDDHEGIIDRETWDRVQRKLGLSNCADSLEHTDTAHSDTDSETDSIDKYTVYDCAGVADRSCADNRPCGNHSHPLFGKIICSDCGSPMIRRTFRASCKKDNNSSYKVWSCKERYKGRQGNGCKMRHVREEELLEAIKNESLNRDGKAGQCQDSGSNTQELEASFADIDYIKVGQNDVSVVWRK